MKKKIVVLLGAFSILHLSPLRAESESPQSAQTEEENLLGRDAGEENKPSGEVIQQEAAPKPQAPLLATDKLSEPAQKDENKRARKLDALREAQADATEYTLSPDAVELVVEMDPDAYGFRTRAHRMSLSGEFDLLLRGRAMLHYDFRFFRYLSVGIVAGTDWTALSLFSRFREQLDKPWPKQFSVLGGVSAKWRLTEWYMRSAIFLEPSFLVGHMWQTLVTQKTTHWRIRPGIFLGLESVFDSGLATTMRFGVEFPYDVGTPNPWPETPDPLFMLGFGLAI